jgi:hypothetical protein
MIGRREPAAIANGMVNLKPMTGRAFWLEQHGKFGKLRSFSPPSDSNPNKPALSESLSGRLGRKRPVVKVLLTVLRASHPTTHLPHHFLPVLSPSLVRLFIVESASGSFPCRWRLDPRGVSLSVPCSHHHYSPVPLAIMAWTSYLIAALNRRCATSNKRRAASCRSDSQTFPNLHRQRARFVCGLAMHWRRCMLGGGISSDITW